MTTVILHMGLPRTGSSALQVSFVQQRATLGAHGITYPAAANDRRALSGGVTAGNGTLLLPHMTGEQPDPAVLDAVRREADGAGDFLLYSSEALWRAKPERVGELAEVVGDVRAVMCVRNVLAHAASCYARNAAGPREVGTFGEYLAGRTARSYRVLAQARNRVEAMERLGVEVRLVHYDAQCDRLVDAVLEAACERSIPLPSPTWVNAGAGLPEASEADMAMLREATAADVEWFNLRLGGSLAL